MVAMSTLPIVDAIARWENAARVMDAMDDHTRTKHFNMAFWGKRTHCGTVACLAGHCGFDPWFREHGMAAEFLDQDYEDLAFEGSQPDKFFGRYAGLLYCTGLKFEEVRVGVDMILRRLREAASMGYDHEDRIYGEGFETLCDHTQRGILVPLNPATERAAS